MRTMREHIVWGVTRDKLAVCLGILEDIESGEFFPVQGSYAATRGRKVHYKEDGRYSKAEGKAIADAGAAVRRDLWIYWSTLGAARKPLKFNTLKEAVRARLS